MKGFVSKWNVRNVTLNLDILSATPRTSMTVSIMDLALDLIHFKNLAGWNKNVCICIRMKLKPIPTGSSISAIDKKKSGKHKAHHSDKHLKSTRMSMLKGSTFEEAHNKAMMSVGK